MQPTLAEPAARAGRREWIGLAVLALPTLLVSLDMSVLFLALPHLSVDLGAGSAQQLWILDIYGFLVAGFLVTMGTVGDRIGRRRLLLIGASAFTVASLVAAYSVNAEMLIAARAVLGIAGATLMPSTLALISNMFPDPRQRAVGIAVWMSCFMVGTAIGPVVGGVLLAFFWWGAVFLLAVPVMAVLLLAGPLLLPEYRDPGAGRLDLASVALSLAAILPIVYGLKELAKDGWHTVPVVAVVVGAAIGFAFVARQRALADPLLDLRLLAHRSAGPALGIMMIGGVLMAGTFLYIPLYLQLVEGLTPLRAGMWLAVPAIAMIASTQLAPRLAQRYRPVHVITVGLVIGTAGALLLTQVGGPGGLAPLIVGFGLACVGIAPAAALGTDLVVGSAPKEKAGSAASVSETSNEFGIALGLAALGSLGAAVYGSRVVVPAEVPAELAGAARESLNGAVLAARELDGVVAGELLGNAHAAFTGALNIVGGVGAAGFAVLAVLAATLLRRA
ncbi:MFS transporter [Qaidamihabitans albus]|uniref:MFS transporter n=1 Tax=Qaidamihabitans albus TaxID=2795733 RepID=UPI0018F154C2|nr:MFS transporter [Qaidamihabitans albus]